MDPKPPSTAAANAFNPISEIEVSTNVIGANSTPAIAATPAEMDHIKEKINLTGIPSNMQLVGFLMMRAWQRQS